MSKHGNRSAAWSVARGAVAVATAWALVWAGVPIRPMALESEGPEQPPETVVEPSGPEKGGVGEKLSTADGVADTPSATDRAIEAVVTEEEMSVETTTIPDASNSTQIVGETAEQAEAEFESGTQLLPASGNIAEGVWGTCSWEIDSSGKLTVHAGTGAELGGVANVPWYINRGDIKSVVFEDGVLLPQSCSMMFLECSALTSVDISRLDTSSVTGMENMFMGCTSLSSLDLSSWNLSSLDSAWGMFRGCSGLQTLKLQGSTLTNARSLNSMFEGCSSLTTLDVSGWKTSSVTSMARMFWNCSSLTSLDVSNWNVSSVKTMDGMFGNCESLSTLDVSDWKTTSLEGMASMFFGCSSLKKLAVSKWDTSKVKSMVGLFAGCTILNDFDVKEWDTSSVTSMQMMFAKCEALIYQDVDEWNTSSVTNMMGMFAGCKSLRGVYTDSWDTSKVTDMTEIFADCSSVEMISISSWDTSALTSSSNMFKGCSPETMIVGEKYIMAGRAEFPQAKSGMVWRDGEYGFSYTTEEIMSQRSGAKGYYEQRLPPSGDVGAAIVDVEYKYARYTGEALEPDVRLIWFGLEKYLIQYQEYVVSYSDNVNPGKATITIRGTGKFKGTVTKSFWIVKNLPYPSIKDPGREAMYRLYNPYSGEHFYTASSVERDYLRSVGWNYEGRGWVAPRWSLQPVYRLYNPYAGDHHYTTSANERDSLVAVGWNYEGIGWYSDDDRGVPLYRQYNPYASVGTHNYTTSKGENDMLVSVGWQAEGIGWYGME